MSTILSELTAEQEIERGVVDLWRAPHEKANLYLLGRTHQSTGHFNIFTKNKVASPDDFKGMKLAGNPAYEPFYKALGASLVNVTASEYYTSLERGLTQGVMRTLGGAVELSLNEVCPYFVDHPIYSGGLLTVINLNAWNSLPSNLQRALQQAHLEALRGSIPFQIEIKKSAKETLIERGMTPVSFGPFDVTRWNRKAHDGTWEAFVKKHPEFGAKWYESMKP